MTINMTKGDKPVSLAKTDLITFKCSWPATTDYDLYAIVVYTNGTHEYIATFPAGKTSGLLRTTYQHPKKLATKDGSVKHLGDEGRGSGTSTEIIEVRLNDRIQAVIPVAYSAQSNGTGSFSRYQVTTQVLAGDQSVTISPADASEDSKVYTLVPGMVVNRGGAAEVQALELYSNPGSERRPGIAYTNGEVRPVMDSGPENVFK